jgi:cobalt-zinc-cadmium efflux system outer membrane protein
VVKASASVPAASAAAPAAADDRPTTLSLDAAVGYALEHNPALTAIRTQRGVAQAGVVIANQYPFNPVLQVFELGANGPASSGITNHAFNETTMRLDLELRGQGRIRRAGAAATLTRTEWDIATQELTTVVLVTRAFNTALYRQKRLEVQDETIRLADEVYEQTKKLADLGRLRPVDVVVARTSRDTARAQRGQAETALAVARADLRRLLGTDADHFTLAGELVVPPPTTDRDALARAAVEVRPDVNARRLMAAEADSLYRLEMANRYGNPSVGPAFEYNETRDTFVGMWLFTPIPVLNTRKGEIMQRKATLTRAMADVRQFETQAGLEVQAALARLEAARKWADTYITDVLPSLKQAVAEVEKLYAANEPGVDVLRVVGVQQNYLQALGVSLDAQFEVSQATADLALAVGDPGLATGVYCRPGQDSRPRPTPPNAAGPALLPAPAPAPVKDKP